MGSGRILCLGAVWLALAGFFAILLEGRAAAQDQTGGRRLVETACLQCHGLRPLAMARGDRRHWEGIIYEMISHGAQIAPPEIDLLLDYLSTTYGDEPVATATDSQSPSPASSDLLPPGPARSALVGACAGCHDLEQAVSFRGDEAGWKDVLERMIQYGAPLSDTDTTGVLRYLVQNYGPSTTAVAVSDSAPVPSQDEGGRLVGAACLQCHSLRPLTMVKGGRDEWEEIVYEMISHGAQIAPREIDPILDYLTRTYPADR